MRAEKVTEEEKIIVRKLSLLDFMSFTGRSTDSIVCAELGAGRKSCRTDESAVLPDLPISQIFTAIISSIIIIIQHVGYVLDRS